MKIKRGDIFWIEQNKYRPAVGSVQKPGRPGIVVSNDANNACSSTVEVVYLTGKPKKALPTHCAINSANYHSIALCEQVTTVSNEQLRSYIGQCTEEEMAEVDRCIAISLGLLGPAAIQDKQVTCSPSFSDEQITEMLSTIKRQELLIAVANAKTEQLQKMYNDLLTRTLA